MPFKEANPIEEYKKNNDLKKEDVRSLQEWAEKQSHLPQLSELEIILFLQSCYCSIETAKTTIDTYFTVKTHCSEFFSKRDPLHPSVKSTTSIGVFEPLISRTPEGYTPIFCKIRDPDASKFVFSEFLKVFDMSTMLWLAQEGTSKGIIIILDMELINLGHLARLGIMTMKKYLFYLQDAMPVRLKGLHFINVVPFMDKVLAIMKPFMKKELMDMLYLHTESIDSLYKHVPKDCLPEDFGGSVDTVEKLHEKMKRRFTDNVEYFAEDELKVVDESKRAGKPKSANDIFGVEGSFKKLDID